MLEIIKRIEPDAVDYKEGKSSYVITLKNGSKVMVHKDLVASKAKESSRPRGGYYNEDGSMNDGQEVSWGRLTAASLRNRPHTHDNTVTTCWDCGVQFCRKCMGPDASFSESYCGY